MRKDASKSTKLAPVTERPCLFLKGHNEQMRFLMTGR